jgi:phospho-N-acetylmuramoyl-pentapeptide-transferase
MLYWLGFEVLFRYYTPFRVFQYSTFRTAMASLTALLLSLALGPWLIRRLQNFQIQQHIRAEGPQSHQKKAGTPTMGGVDLRRDSSVHTGRISDRAVWVALARCVGATAYGTTIRGRAQTQLGLTCGRNSVWKFLRRC